MHRLNGMLARLTRAWRTLWQPMPDAETDDEFFGLTDEDVAPPRPTVPHVYTPTGKDEYGPMILSGGSSPQNASVRMALEQALEHARKNDTISLFLVSVTDEGRCYQAMAGAVNYTLLGFVESAKGDLMELMK